MGFQRRFLAVLIMGKQSELVNGGIGSWSSGRSWRRCHLGCQWISVGTIIWKCGWGLKYIRWVTNSHWVTLFNICIYIWLRYCLVLFSGIVIKPQLGREWGNEGGRFLFGIMESVCVICEIKSESLCTTPLSLSPLMSPFLQPICVSEDEHIVE